MTFILSYEHTTAEKAFEICKRAVALTSFKPCATIGWIHESGAVALTHIILFFCSDTIIDKVGLYGTAYIIQVVSVAIMSFDICNIIGTISS